MQKPLCFILMPYGVKNVGEVKIDFDLVYEELIKPAIIEVGLDPIRADEEMTGGIIHKPMFERLVLCEFALADLTGASANVFYELGIRHANKPHTTILLFAKSTRLPFDVAPLRGIPYSINSYGKLANVDLDKEALKNKLRFAVDNRTDDSPLFQLLDGYPNVAHEKTDVFRNTIYSGKLKKKLLDIRQSEESPEKRLESLIEFEETLDPISQAEAGVIIDLFLSYRSISEKSGYSRMIELTKKMPKPLANTVLVREQKAFALNRVGKDREAEQELKGLITEHGPSSETYGLLGRVYKDRWLRAYRERNGLRAKGALKEAITAYTKGFESDPRDAYPGVNALTLMFIEDSDSTDFEELMTVVRYAVNQNMKRKEPDYWDYATHFELDVLISDFESAEMNLARASTCDNVEAFMPETTLKNLMMIQEVKESNIKLKHIREFLEGWINDLRRNNV